ncbi:hypothetical protein HDA41_000104 [Streptomyces caelestis]|uniref:Uncharacterized protein n=1 Tax=Streptomyces caelestis TaxID=36816 RepID=A0A7W9GY06_9ACTN|nr:hypothetical protein [Streptomyces caelestis]
MKTGATASRTGPWAPAGSPAMTLKSPDEGQQETFASSDVQGRTCHAFLTFVRAWRGGSPLGRHQQGA